MMCDKCGKNPATTHIKTVVNGVQHQSNLCAYCAAKEGYHNFGQLSLTNLLTSMFSDSMTTEQVTGKRCTCCGGSFSDIVESGRVGCSECYHVFRKELMPSLNRLHGKAMHIGAAPKAETKQPTKEERLTALRKKLSEAIAAEAFEEAVTLRDEIRTLEGEESNRA